MLTVLAEAVSALQRLRNRDATAQPDHGRTDQGGFEMRIITKWITVAATATSAALLITPASGAETPDRSTPTNVRITPDHVAGAYRAVDGSQDATQLACGGSRQSQAEAAVAIDPSNPDVVAVGAMDGCLMRRHAIPAAQPQHWAGLYRSQDGGQTWSAALLPGYPGDLSDPGLQTQTGCQIQADSTLAFDADGRLFYGGLCLVWQGDTAPIDFHIAVATFEDHGARLVHTARADGADRLPLSPDDLATASDKPNLAVDQSTSPHRGNLYVAYSSCPRVVPERGPESIAPCVGSESVLRVARSVDHGQSFDEPVTIASAAFRRPHFADVTVGPDGNVHVVFRTNADDNGVRSVYLSTSQDGGRTFSEPSKVADFTGWSTGTYAGKLGPTDSTLNGAHNGGLPCGDGPFACPSGFTLPPLPITAAVVSDDRGVHVVWGGASPDGRGRIFSRHSPDGRHWPEAPSLVDDHPVGHQWLPDIVSDGKVLSIVYFDSRHDPAYAPDLPPGNTAERTSSGPAVDTFVAQSHNRGRSWEGRRVSSVSTAPNLETYLDARAPWRGDYLYASAVPGRTYAVWPDSRDIVVGTDPRSDNRGDGFDVHAPCAWVPNSVNGPATGYPTPPAADPCYQQGGLDQNVYGAWLTDDRPAQGRRPSVERGEGSRSVPLAPVAVAPAGMELPATGADPPLLTGTALFTAALGIRRVRQNARPPTWGFEPH